MFQSTKSSPGGITLAVAGHRVTVPPGSSVATALLLKGDSACRTTPKSGTPRGPYCMMGVCHECLVVIDGRPNQQGCLVQAREGMVVEPQDGAWNPLATLPTADTDHPGELP
ncbi:MAG: (2Fe-2S)-binding protein [Candidatus Competibacterales bacterium]